MSRRSASDVARDLNASDPLGTMANGSYWPELPPDESASFIVADNYRRPMLRGVRAVESRAYRALRSSAALRFRQVGR